MRDDNQSIGVFPVTFQTEQEIAGQPLLKINLLIDIAGSQIAGVAQVFESTSLVATALSNIMGDWSYMANMASPHILLVAEGHESTHFLDDELVPFGLNFRLRASLEADWRSGVINFEYQSNASWHKVGGANIAVKLINQDELLQQLQYASQPN